MITSSIIGYGDQGYVQISTMAELIYFSKKNNHDLCFYSKLKNFKRKFHVYGNKLSTLDMYIMNFYRNNIVINYLFSSLRCFFE